MSINTKVPIPSSAKKLGQWFNDHKSSKRLILKKTKPEILICSTKIDSLSLSLITESWKLLIERGESYSAIHSTSDSTGILTAMRKPGQYKRLFKYLMKTPASKEGLGLLDAVVDHLFKINFKMQSSGTKFYRDFISGCLSGPAYEDWKVWNAKCNEVYPILYELQELIPRERCPWNIFAKELDSKDYQGYVPLLKSLQKNVSKLLEVKLQPNFDKVYRFDRSPTVAKQKSRLTLNCLYKVVNKKIPRMIREAENFLS